MPILRHSKWKLRDSGTYSYFILYVSIFFGVYSQGCAAYTSPKYKISLKFLRLIRLISSWCFRGLITLIANDEICLRKQFSIFNKAAVYEIHSMVEKLDAKIPHAHIDFPLWRCHIRAILNMTKMSRRFAFNFHTFACLGKSFSRY